MSEMKPCPFCGEIVKECNDVATPIDVALRKRIAKLEAENIRLGIEYQRMRLALGDIAINSKRALKESPTDHLTAQWRQERQDDKSSNDTQTQTIVYGKEDSEVQE